MRFTRFIGIDPGKDGAIAYLDDEGELINIVKMPVISGIKSKTKKEYDIPAMVDLLLKDQLSSKRLPIGGTFVVLEQLQTMPPGMGGSQANFQRGFAYGSWLGILTAMKHTFLTVRPQKWQGALISGHKDTKQGSVMVAQRTWPRFDFRRSERAKKPDDGKTDAALIGLYGQMINKDGRLLEHIRS